ncbi:MAG: TRAP transporter large permease subunit [Rhodoferax sp.]|nr:TRAP transporter large permease subunit [Rhodoferax sp.]MDP3652711.1 TRAP transporter large permease subunit [Rhodoferax sp.]
MTLTVFLGSLMAAMALGMPIAFALLVCGTALMLFMGQFDAQILAQNVIAGADNFVLMAVPFFILAGELMNAGGLSKRIVQMASAWVGHIRGGLGYVTILSALILASLSGSAVADTAALAALLIPMMRDAGYNTARSAGLVASAGIIAPVIPPSIGFIIFGVVGGVSITKLFVAGIFPGLLMALSLVLTWWWVSRRDALQVAPRMAMQGRLAAMGAGVWALVLPLIIVGGLKGGIFTPTEAGVVAAFYALFVGAFIYRELNLASIYHALLATAKTTAVVMFLVAAAFVSAYLITVADIPSQLKQVFAPFMDSPKLLMAVMMVVVVIVGTALDFIPSVLILTPVMLPICVEAGIDPVYFGVLFIMNNAIGMITPPVGVVLNVAAGVGKVSIEDVIRGVWPFMLAETAILFLLVLFPELVMVPMQWFR